MQGSKPSRMGWGQQQKEEDNTEVLMRDGTNQSDDLLLRDSTFAVAQENGLLIDAT